MRLVEGAQRSKVNEAKHVHVGGAVRTLYSTVLRHPLGIVLLLMFYRRMQ